MANKIGGLIDTVTGLTAASGDVVFYDPDPANTWAGASYVGKVRYKMTGDTSYVQMYMQTGAATFGWIPVKTFSWAVKALLNNVPSGTAGPAVNITVYGAGVTHYCHALDADTMGTAEIPVATAIILTLTEGSHYVSVIGRNAAGVWQGEPTVSSAWVVDATPPAVVLTGMPAGSVDYATASVTVAGNDVAAYKYAVDAGSYSAVEILIDSPVITLDGLLNGVHTLKVVGRDIRGNWQTAASEVSWTVALAAPTARLTGVPVEVGGVVGVNTATITVHDVDAYKYKTSLAGSYSPAEIPAAAPISLTGLADGEQTVYVVGRDAFGNWQVEPTAAAWTVLALRVILTGVPSGTVGTDPLAIWVGGAGINHYTVQWFSHAPSAHEISTVPYNDFSHSVNDPIPYLWGHPRGQTYYLVVWGITGDFVGYDAVPAVASWTVSTAAATASLVGAPSGTVGTTSASIQVGGAGVLSYKYRTNNGAESGNILKDTLITLSAAAEGYNTLYVWGRNGMNYQTTPTTASWTVQTMGTSLVIEGLGAGLLNLADVPLSVSGDRVTHYQYKLDDVGDYSAEAAIDTPLVLNGLREGTHHVDVRGRSIYNNGWQSPTTASFTVDTVAPYVWLFDVPTGATQATTAEIRVGGADVVSYQYSLDGGAYGSDIAVATPISLAGLADGPHYVSVKGRDLAGNLRNPTVSTTWIVDTVAPIALLSGVPTGRTQATTADIYVSGDGVESYLWSLDGVTSNPGYRTGPLSLVDLADGPHYVSVRGCDLAGNLQAIPTTSSTWTVDNVAPGAQLSGVPTGATQATTAEIRVGRDDDDVVSYQYSLDGGAYSSDIAVATPISLAGLADGTHYVRVKGRDSAGNLDEMPTIPNPWTVDTIAPTAQLSGVPTGTTQATTAEIQVSGAGMVSYQYSLDGGAYSSDIAAATPISLAGLADGTHYVSVRGCDLAGNLQYPATVMVFNV